MPLTFAVVLAQQQTFTLRCSLGDRPLDRGELEALIEWCEQQYYPKYRDLPQDLIDYSR